MAVWLVGYLLLFGVLTVQDQLAGPQPVPYTEFKNQVASKNVGALFARGNSIQGELKKLRRFPTSRSGRINSSRPSGRRSRPTTCSLS
jgi:cell division protease FtsH